MTQHLIQTFVRYIHQCDVGIVVSIAAFQAVDPGSIPGHRNATFLSLFTICFQEAFNEFGIIYKLKDAISIEIDHHASFSLLNTKKKDSAICMSQENLP